MKKVNKMYGFIKMKNAFFCEVGIGVSANAILLLFHILMSLLGPRPKPTDLIIGLMALIHLLMLINMGCLSTDMFVSQYIWDDIKCISHNYLYKVLRGGSICATCLLSVLQAITLSPRSLCLTKLRHKSPQHSLCSLLALWVIYMSSIDHFTYYAVANSSLTSPDVTFVTESCAVLPMSSSLRPLFSTVGIFRDGFLLGVMGLSSGYMVTLLHRHKRQSQHLHSTSLSPKESPEQRATCTILQLMTLFVVMYCLDCVITSSRIIQNNNDPIHLCLQMVVANGYSTISPLVFISSEKRIISFVKYLWVGRMLIFNYQVMDRFSLLANNAQLCKH